MIDFIFPIFHLAPQPSAFYFPATQVSHGKIKMIQSNSENKPWGLYFSKALSEGLIFGGAYVRREICVSKAIGLVLFLAGNLPFFFVLLCI